MPKPKLPPLNDAIRADLFTHLATMEKAGLPVAQAFLSLRLAKAAQPRVDEARKWLGRGKDVAAAGRMAGLFSDLEADLLHAAISAGSPAHTYFRLAERYALKARLSKQMRSKMMLPIVVFVLALLVQPLPDLVLGALSPAAYLWRCLRPMLFFISLYGLFRGVSDWLEVAQPSRLRLQLETMLIKMPLFGAMHVRRNARDFFESMALMLEAGLPMFDALPKANRAIHNQLIRSEYSRILPKMQRGDSLAKALDQQIFLGEERVIGFVQTGEASGTLPEMLLRHVNIESEHIADFQSKVAEWFPRIVYGLLMLWMAYGMLAGNGAAVPEMPADL
ncbi:type II secretion system F family protein [Iodobacter sp. CM08]|uniref:type II secretion system F family protein n=1 Tax=Iodobacter sp. CM08 TaxID=3085902 RepID=UPI0029827DC0|nr:type II secretion system F family protein [Iodobacter sp. CM08]MDW5416729.1 type II secretion system F family protein [Iodobacter sp. CM08]